MRRPAFRVFRRLTRHFASGLVDRDLIAPGADLHAPIAGVLGACLVLSACTALMFLGKYNSVRLAFHGNFKPAQFQTLADKLAMAVDDKTLLLAGVMLVMALVTTLFWDAVALDARDLAVFGPLPLRPATVMLAKATAVTLAAVVLAVALNLLPAVFFPMVVLAKVPVSLLYLLRSIAAHAVAGICGCIFVFLLLFAVRAVLQLMLRPTLARRVLPLLQALLVVVWLSLLLALPLLVSGVRSAIDHPSASLFRLPPLWFLGIEEVLIGRADGLFVDLARLGTRALALSIGAAALVQGAAMMLRSQRAGLAAGSPSSLAGQAVAAAVRTVARLIAKDGRARASFLFTAYALTRSPLHRLYLAGALGVGIAVAGLTVGAVYAGVGLGPLSLSLTTMGLAGQLNVIFFLVVGMRMAMTVPADLEAGWIFRFHATPALQRHLAGTRAAIFCLVVLPVLMPLAPLHAFLWGGYVATVHFAFGVVVALGLLEVTFRGYTKVPFVAAFTSSQTLLSPRIGAYVAGYLLLVYATPGLEQLLVTRTAMFYAWVAMFAVLVGRFLASQSTRARRDRLPSFDDPGERVAQLGLQHTRADQQGLTTTGATAAPLAEPLFGEFARSPWLTLPGARRLRAWSFSQFQRELAHASRRLRTNPSFTVFSVMTLALGIGVTTVIYSVVYGSVLRPLDVTDLDRVVNLYHSSPSSAPRRFYTSFSRLDVDDLRAAQTVFTGVAAHAPFRQVLVANGTGEATVGEMVSGDYFTVLGVQPALGRLLQPDDDRPGAPPAVVIDYRTWQRRFQGRADVVGHTLRLAGSTFVIIGVAPPRFHGVELPNLAPTRVWIPLSGAAVLGGAPVERDREARFLLAKGRLAPGRTVEDARAQLRVIGSRLDAVAPIGRDLPAALRSPPYVSRRWTALPAADRLLTEEADPNMRWIGRLLMIAVGLVLLVASTNVANLTLARGTSRRRELAVRLALGASRWDVIREQLVESAIVASMSATAALAAVYALTRTGAIATIRLGPWFSVNVETAFDWPIALIGLATTVLALLVFGLVPALQLTRPGLSIANLGEGGSGATAKWRGRRWLIASQVTVSVALVALASVSVQQIARSAARDSGFDVDRLAVVRFDFEAQGWTADRARGVLERLQAHIGAQPGIDAVTIASGLPMDGMSRLIADLTTPDRPFAEPRYYGRRLPLLSASPSSFATFGVPIVDGRPFTQSDSAAAPRVIILSELASRTLFGTTASVGRQVLRRVQPAGPGRPATVDALTVVGIAHDTGRREIGARSEGMVYVPLAQQYTAYLAVMARASESPGAALASMKGAIARLEPELAIVDAGTGRELGNPENLAFEITAALAGALGLLSLTLAMIGLYGVLSFVVSQRTHEMGIRVALGASHAQIMRLILADGLRPVLEGLVVGFVLGDLAVMALKPAFVGPPPAIDATVLAAVPPLFLAAALFACYLPSRRAARVAPNVALRE